MNIDIKDLIAKLNGVDVKDFLKKLIKNREFLSFAGAIVFIISILTVGNILLAQRAEAVRKRDSEKLKYEMIAAGETDKEKLLANIDAIKLETLKKQEAIVNVTQKEIAETLNQWQKSTGLTWNSSPSYSNKPLNGDERYQGIVVKIEKYSGSYDNFKKFIDTVGESERKIIIENITLAKDKITGRMIGSITLTFYMEKAA